MVADTKSSRSTRNVSNAVDSAILHAIFLSVNGSLQSAGE